MTDCLFCKIVSGTIKVPLLFENDKLIAIQDKFPQAPAHQLVIPKKHYDNLNAISPSEMTIVSEIFVVAKALAQKAGIAEKGFRTVFNTNKEGGQSVLHLHLHILGGKQLGGSMVG